MYELSIEQCEDVSGSLAPQHKVTLSGVGIAALGIGIALAATAPAIIAVGDTALWQGFGVGIAIVGIGATALSGLDISVSAGMLSLGGS